MKRFYTRSLPLVMLSLMLAAFIAGTSSCKKEKLLTSGGELKFSADTLTFDTVFTTQGSFTVEMKIYNPQNQKITISSVRLAGGASSQFHLNVDGFAGNNISNIDIAAKDSAYVFATVDVNPDNQDAPFVVEDKLIATLNGTDFTVPFIAYGQNAHYIKNDTDVSGVWGALDKKPYVLIGYSIIKPGKSLNIIAGTHLYMHADARMFVQGNLATNGTLHDSVIFQGDRLDRKYFGYEGYPGEWGGLYFDSASTGTMTHTILENGGNGAFGAIAALVQLNPTAYLKLDRCTIQNSIGYGIISFGGHLRADNSLIQQCGAQAVAIVQGGNDTLNNCTLALYGNNKVNHIDNPALVVLNYYKPDDVTLIPGALSAVFRNCVVYGSLDNEVVVDSVSNAAAAVSFDHCVLKAAQSKLPVWVQGQSNGGIIYNADPLFMDIAKWNYHVKAGSSLLDNGLSLGAGLDKALDDVQRPAGGGWDIGAYEQ